MMRPEILAPAGDMTSLAAALQSGADAVYLGLASFNMRSRSSANFSREGLVEASRRCRERDARLYLALNSIVFEDELPEVEETLAFAKPFIDAAIVADWGVAAACRKLSVPFHISTQMSCSNSEAARFMKAQGASRIVLARECSLDEAARIARTAGIETECFVHGAQCVAESGRCLLSHEAYGCSANRGECHQPCRRRFLVKAIDRFADADGSPLHVADAEFEVTPHTVLSAKDLCSLPFIDRLVAAGISSFKIEGRARNAEYVRTVTAAYRAAVDAVCAGAFTPALAERLVEETKKVFHREFSPGLYFGRPGADQFTDVEDSSSALVKRHVGVIMDYFLKAGIAQVKIQDEAMRIGDVIQIHGPTTGVHELTVTSLRRDDEVLESAERGSWATLPAPRCRVGDKVFKMTARAIARAAACCLALAAATGCLSSGSRPPVKSWTIEPASSADATQPASADELSPPPFKSTRLGAITVLPPYDTAPFRVKRADGTLAEDAYNVFAAAPAQLLRRPVIEALSRNPRFGRTVPPASTASAEAVAEVMVTELALDCRDRRKATVTLDVNVVKGRDVVLSGKASGECDAQSGDYSAAFSRAFGDALRNSLQRLK